MPPGARIAAAVAAGTLIAACGSSSPDRSASTGHPTQAQILDQLHRELVGFAGCMRTHGVSNFPDPTSPGSDKEFLLGQIPGINPQSPAFQSAHAVCKHFLPGGGTTSPAESAPVMAQLLHTSRCMRAHGVTGFPDPTTSPPSNQAAANLDVVAFSGNHAPPGSPPVAYLSISNSINPNSPVAEHAASACHFRLP